MIFLGKEVRNFGKPFFVAEISGNHGGDLNRVYALIDIAKKVGADAVKIQCYNADALTIPNGYIVEKGLWGNKQLYELYMSACTPYEWMPEIFNYASHVKMPIFSSVYDDRGIEALNTVNCKAFKIASFEANDPNFVQKIVQEGKPVVMSTGTLSEQELIRSVNLLDSDNSILLHCVSKYPCDLTECGLNEITSLMSDFDMPIGFSCHTDDPLAVFLAISKGAALIELHLAIDDDIGRKAEDYPFSFIEESLAYTIRKSDEIRRTLGLKNPNIEQTSTKLKRSLYVIDSVRKGEVFTKKNIGSYRPNLGCSPHLLMNILGRKANRDITKYSPMKMEYVE